MYAEDIASQSAQKRMAGEARGQFVGGLAERPMEIPNQLEAMEHRIKGIHQGLDHLENRLEATVARSQPPQTTSAGSGVAGAVPNTSVGARLHGYNDMLERLNDRIQSLIARLEV